MRFLASIPELCDITFLVGETREPVCAVKAVLAARSRSVSGYYLEGISEIVKYSAISPSIRVFILFLMKRKGSWQHWVTQAQSLFPISSSSAECRGRKEVEATDAVHVPLIGRLSTGNGRLRLLRVGGVWLGGGMCHQPGVGRAWWVCRLKLQMTLLIWPMSWRWLCRSRGNRSELKMKGH